MATNPDSTPSKHRTPISPLIAKSPLRRFFRYALLLMPASLISVMAMAPASADELSQAWYLNEYRTAEIWKQTQGEGITVAVIDTGVDASVSELKGQVLEGVDLLSEGGNGQVDASGHGTEMASLIAGTGSDQGVQGLAPKAKILPIRAAYKPGELKIELGVDERVAQAIDIAAESDADILSIAVDTRGENPRHKAEIDEAIAKAARSGKLIFAAAGNDAQEGYRAATIALQDGAVGVAAVDRQGERAYYSQHGSFIGLAAPGQEIPLRCGHPDGAVCLQEGGTSAASALASASAALIWSANPDWTKNQVLRVMMETADGPTKTPRNHYVGYGIVRPDRVILDGEGDPGDPDTNPMFERYEAELDPPATPAPNAPEDTTTSPEDTTPAPAAPDNTQEQATGTTDNNNGPLILFTTAAGILTLGTLTALWMRRKQTRSSS